jgi:hypothetical protein
MTAIETAAAPARRLEWQQAQVRQIAVETYRVKSLLQYVAGWQGQLPGQHVDIRLTAEDGYQAQRSYSIASPPQDELIALTVERVDSGEVSPYLVGELRVGDRDRSAAILFGLSRRAPPLMCSYCCASGRIGSGMTGLRSSWTFIQTAALLI